jgi:hypothetical protein
VIQAAAGAHDRIRTGDLVLTKDVLYLLSYVGLFPQHAAAAARRRTAGKKWSGRRESNSRPSAWKADALTI